MAKQVFLVVDSYNNPGHIYGVFSTELKAYKAAQLVDLDAGDDVTSIEVFTLNELPSTTYG